MVVQIVRTESESGYGLGRSRRGRSRRCPPASTTGGGTTVPPCRNRHRGAVTTRILLTHTRQRRRVAPSRAAQEQHTRKGVMLFAGEAATRGEVEPSSVLRLASGNARVCLPCAPTAACADIAIGGFAVALSCLSIRSRTTPPRPDFILSLPSRGTGVWLSIRLGGWVGPVDVWTSHVKSLARVNP